MVMTSAAAAAAGTGLKKLPLIQPRHLEGRTTSLSAHVLACLALPCLTLPCLFMPCLSIYLPRYLIWLVSLPVCLPYLTSSVISTLRLFLYLPFRSVCLALLCLTLSCYAYHSTYLPVHLFPCSLSPYLPVPSSLFTYLHTCLHALPCLLVSLPICLHACLPSFYLTLHRLLV